MAKMCWSKMSDHLDNDNCVDIDVILGTLCYNSWALHVGTPVPFKENKLATPYL
jgi:hypothetical protein